LSKRIWWTIYTLDRLNAAQEGTPCIINEGDCDQTPLAPDDFLDEDDTTRELTLTNMKLALIVEDAIRTLYTAQGDRLYLDSPLGEEQRDRVLRKLDALEARVGGFAATTLDCDHDQLACWTFLFRVQ
jgi:hypothetical protein